MTLAFDGRHAQRKGLPEFRVLPSIHVSATNDNRVSSVADFYLWSKFDPANAKARNVHYQFHVGAELLEGGNDE